MSMHARAPKQRRISRGFVTFLGGEGHGLGALHDQATGVGRAFVAVFHDGDVSEGKKPSAGSVSAKAQSQAQNRKKKRT